MYSCVAPGPPWSRRTLIDGLLPVRFVHTLNVPFGVVIGIVFTPPLNTSSRPVLSKYDAAAEGRAFSAGGGVAAGVPHAMANAAVAIRQISRFMVCSSARHDSIDPPAT